MIVLAVDPGKMTGLALWIGDEVNVATQGELHKAMSWCESVIELYAPLGLHVVVEAFVITRKTLQLKNDHTAIAGIEICRFLCHKHNAYFVLPMQKPSDAKNFATDKMLKTIGWYKPSPGGHVNDALRHLLLYLVRSGRQDLVSSFEP